MNKTTEILILEEAIKKLGKDSYLASWLDEVKHEVIRDITSDFSPSMLPSQSLAKSREIINTANEHAKLTYANTKKEADQIMLQAYNEAARTKNHLYSTVKDVLKKLDS